MAGKVNREDFLLRVAKRTGFDLADVNDIYYGIISEIEDIAKSGDRLSLAGFGAFYAQTHKGHPVQFGDNGRKVEDYVVFKFSASSVFNKRLRDGVYSPDVMLSESKPCTDFCPALGES